MVPIVHFTRRLLLSISLVQGHDIFWVQLSVQMAVSTFFVIFVGWYMPFDTNKANRLEIFTECVTVFALYILMLFTDFVPGAETRYYCGAFFIALVIIYTLVHLTVIVHEALVNLKRAFKRWLYKRRRL